MAEPHEKPVREEISDEEKIRVVEDHYKRCWPCIRAGISECRHFLEREDELRLQRTRVGFDVQHWMAYEQTKRANFEAFRGELHPEASPIEIRLLQAFWDVGLDPVQQYKIAGYIVDFAFPRARLAVEADGAEYHTDKERERKRDEAIRKAGWHIVHFAGSTIHQDADLCVSTVYELARSSLV